MYSEEEAYDMQNPLQGEGENDKVNALNLKWALGMNYAIKNGVHNLSNENRKELFYAAAHSGVLYDFENGTQRLLQGHVNKCNKITCTNYCQQEDILITADEGPDSMLVVWDAKTATPRKTIFDPHPNGVEALDITPDGRYIITVSKEKNPEKDLQNFTLWDWKNDGPANIITCEIHPEVEDYQYHVLFNSNKPKEFVSTGKKRVLFWSWESHEKGFELYSPAFSQPKTFTQTVFIPGSSQAVTGTSDGYIVVWDVSLILEDFSQPEERRAIKVVNLLDPTQNKSESSKGKKAPEITTLLIQGNHLVIGASNGTVRFYDLQFRIIAWFEDIGIGKITSISFAKDNTYQYTHAEEDKKKDKDTLTCPDFIVVDTNCVVTMLRSELFSIIDDEKKKGVVLMKLLNSPITAISVRPNSYTVALVCENGRLYEWNYYDRSPILEPKKVFESNNLPTCIEYSPDGRFLCVGTVKGALFFNDYSLDKNGNEVGWTNEEDHQVSKDKARKGTTDKSVSPKILQLAFSPDSQYLAVMDDHCCCTLFKIDYQYRNMNKAKEWIFSGKLKIHKQPLRGIAFGESRRILDKQDQPETYLRLFSISEDKKLVEYDVSRSNNNRLYEKDIITIEQETNPCAVIWYPVNKFKEDILMVINEDYKIKLWNVSDDHKYTKKTCLGPTYGGPINRLLVINTPKDSEKYLAYSTANKVIGLIKLPADGNPHNNMGLIAHPDEITGIAVSSDGNYLFTSGGGDYTVNMWHIDIGTMEQTMYNTGDPMVPFIDLLEGGQEGQLLRDLKDFFYYSQIRSKDENTTKFRKLEGMVPLNELANLMRALGYYPTNKEIENMMKEVEFSKFPDDLTTVKEADLDTCIKLFVNHRPIYGIGKKQIHEAVNVIAAEDEKGEEKKIPWDRLYELLQTRGEPMNEEEIKEAFERLLGDEAENEIPEVIDAEVLSKDVLGFEEADTDEIIMESQN